jgi:two-component system sensor histidine kinase UhpB
MQMRRRNLLTQVLVANLMIIVAAVVAAGFAASPDLSLDLDDDPAIGLILGLAVGITVLVNVYMLQRRFRPLERLVDEMEHVDLSRPGANLPDLDGGVLRRGDPEEVERLHESFRRMLDRLEAERLRASSAALTAQEEERARIARDLHDEVNQSLTGLLLRLEAMKSLTPDTLTHLAHELNETKSLANQAMEELLTLARQLRPTALDDHGLAAALKSQVDDLERRGGVNTAFESYGDFTHMPEPIQLVVYRVAQEALSNANQHSGAENIRVRLSEEPGGHVELSVSDDGRGFTFEQATTGLGLGGMRERALLVGGDLNVESRPDLGTRVRLRVPIGVSARAGNGHS